MKENESPDNIQKDSLNEKLIHFNHQKQNTSNNKSGSSNNPVPICYNEKVGIGILNMGLRDVKDKEVSVSVMRWRSDC